MTILWEPPADVLERSRIGGYLRWLAEYQGLDLRVPGSPERTYDALWRWSVEEIPAFWRSIWDYFGVIAHAEPSAVLEDPGRITTRWFPGARLNYAEHVLRMPGLAETDPAVLAYSQSREPVTLTVAEVRDQVRRVRAGLRRLGVAPGDTVAAYLPNIPETFVLMLAAASLGATFTSCAPEFGTRSVVDRWLQVEPKVLVTIDGYRYGDKAVDRREEVAAIRAALPSLSAVVALDYLGTGEAPDATRWSDLAWSDLAWSDLAAPTEEPLAFEPVPFDHPLYVLFSSGTTGLPKAIVHGHGGILLEHLKKLALHSDLGPGDRFFWFSTTGWMMWNFLVSGPAVGAAIVLVDGNPAYPDLGWLWRTAAEAGVTFFGTSAPFLLSCRKAGIVPRELADLSALRGVGSTGAPLPAEGFTWVYEAVGTDLLLGSVSGGTDVCTGFVGAAPLLPVVAGEIACRCLGAKVEAYAPDGTSIVDQLGELVITAPMPSFPVRFLGDPDGEKYADAYFSMYPGVWRHGDWITITARGSCTITGRSDATLNRGGVRLGTSEFYSVVEGLDEVVDSLVVHLEDPAGGAGELLLFVVLAVGVAFDDELRRRLVRELRGSLSPRHVPDEVYQVRSVPRTLSGKKLEVPVKRILAGTAVDRAAAKGALANPESLTEFESLAKSR